MTPEPGAEALRVLAAALAPHLRELLVAERRDCELVDVAIFCAVDKQRAIAGACRSGAIAGARKVARKWKAPASSVRAWLEKQGPRAVRAPDAEVDEFEAMRRRLARAR
jgi:hypothetical protein